MPGLVRCSSRLLRGAGIGGGFSAVGENVGDFCETEIEDFCAASFGDKDVGGFYVAVDDAGTVSHVERVGDFDGDFEEAFEVERAVGDDVLERGAVEKFHGDEGAVVVGAEDVDGADVRVIESGGGAGFALEALERLRIVREIFGEKFWR